MENRCNGNVTAEGREATVVGLEQPGAGGAEQSARKVAAAAAAAAAEVLFV